jgi:hypothetical protein
MKSRILVCFGGRKRIETVEQETLDFLMRYPSDFKIRVLEENIS